MASIIEITNPLTGAVEKVDKLDHTAQEIDSAVSRALPGGEIDGLLAGKAPAGYGLGGGAKALSSSDNFDNITVCGWYQWDTEPANGPGIANGQMIVLNGVYGLVTQVIYHTKGTTAQRSCYYGTWQPWEWVNPLMELGVEYRTTERYLGKPVYYKLVDGGTAPNNSSKDISIGVSNIDHAFIDLSRSEIYAAGPTNLLPTFGDVVNVIIFNGYIRVHTTSDRSSYAMKICAKYTKTTD